MQNTKLAVFDSFGKLDGANIIAPAAAGSSGSQERKKLDIENTEVGQKRMDEPGEPSISDMLKQRVSKFEDKLQSDLLIYDLDESLENETYQ